MQHSVRVIVMAVIEIVGGVVTRKMFHHHIYENQYAGTPLNVTQTGINCILSGTRFTAAGRRMWDRHKINQVREGTCDPVQRGDSFVCFYLLLLYNNGRLWHRGIRPWLLRQHLFILINSLLGFGLFMGFVDDKKNTHYPYTALSFKMNHS